MPILFLIGEFHLDHLYKCHVTHDVTLCMITKLTNKWMFTFCKYNCLPFHCAYLMLLSSYSTGHMQISNDAKLIMVDGTYKDIRGAEPRHP
jgi:hypothetical protein